MSMAYHRSLMAGLLREAETQREIRRIMRDRGKPSRRKLRISPAVHNAVRRT